MTNATGHDVGSTKEEAFALKLLHGVARWLGLLGWEARLVRRSLVYQERFRDAFEAFDAGDYAAAFSLFKRDAKKGSSIAQHNVGILYEAGYGISVNDKEAERYFRLAAGHGVPEAQYALGMMVATEITPTREVVLTKDVQKAVEGYMWLYTARLGGKRDARQALKRLRKVMSSNSIREAEINALNWRAEHMHRLPH